jgi:hypothetical protein
MTPQEDFVRRFREASPDNDDEVDIFLGWLQENGPDEWHRWACNWNMDHGIDLFEWIVAQPNCDKGTALTIYYRAQPDYYTRFASLDEANADSFGDDAIDLMILICKTWSAYSTYAYRPDAFVCDEYLGKGEGAMQALAAAAPWNVPDGLSMAGLHGQPNDFGRTIDGVPVEMLRALGEDW